MYSLEYLILSTWNLSKFDFKYVKIDKNDPL